MSETYSCHFTSVPTILDSFLSTFKCDPRIDDIVTMDEITKMFNEKFPKQEDDTHIIDEEELLAFFRKINEIQVDRIMGKLVKDGMVDMMHDGTEFHFRITEKGKKEVHKGF